MLLAEAPSLTLWYKCCSSAGTGGVDSGTLVRVSAPAERVKFVVMLLKGVSSQDTMLQAVLLSFICQVFVTVRACVLHALLDGNASAGEINVCYYIISSYSWHVFGCLHFTAPVGCWTLNSNRTATTWGFF